MKKTPKPMGELDLIDRIRRGSSGARSKTISLGIGDDCAILRPPPGHETLVTTDFSLEDRHFLRNRHPPESVGHRCLARGLSDLAAMGAAPIAAFLSLALPAAMLKTRSGQNWIDRFFLGLHHLGNLHHTPLAGGDTSESPSGLIFADIVLIGSAPRGHALRRSGAHPGDSLYVTGALGGASAELATTLSRKRPIPRIIDLTNHPHLFPQPRLVIGETLRHRNLATACIDLSDGLSTDLTHLCESSNLRAEIDVSALPIHPLAKKLAPQEALQAALHGGEDYELLFAAPANIRMPKKIAGISITRIGTLHPSRTHQPRLTLKHPNGSQTELKPAGWQHFTSTTTKR